MIDLRATLRPGLTLRIEAVAESPELVDLADQMNASLARATDEDLILVVVGKSAREPTDTRLGISLSLPADDARLWHGPALPCDDAGCPLST